MNRAYWHDDHRDRGGRRDRDGRHGDHRDHDHRARGDHQQYIVVLFLMLLNSLQCHCLTIQKLLTICSFQHNRHLLYHCSSHLISLVSSILKVQREPWHS